MNQSLRLAGAKVLVTGATGFIGGRLVEYLSSGCGAQVRALVHNFGPATYIARLPVELIHGDLLDLHSVRDAVAGCDFIFHCAYGSSGEDSQRRQVTVGGTENLAIAAADHGVRRFVNVSTVAVHGPDPGEVVDEASPYAGEGDAYAETKIEAERILFRYAGSNGLPVAIIRPAVVYGPRAPSWTVNPVRQIQAGSLTLIENGLGIANHVYVDDVVQALLLAATEPKAIGEAFVISYGVGATWMEFFGHYARMLGLAGLPSLSLVEIDERKHQLDQLHNPISVGLSFFASAHARYVIRQFPVVGQAFDSATRICPPPVKRAILSRAESVRATRILPPSLPAPSATQFFTSRCVCRIDKAKRLLGYEPGIPLDEGMRLTEQWLQYAGLV